MPTFEIINNASEIALNNKWVPATKFNSRGRFVTKEGRQYQIIEKRERTFSGLECFGRAFLGTLIVIYTFCLALFSKSVRNLFTKTKENMRFAILAPNENLLLQKDPIKSPSKEIPQKLQEIPCKTSTTKSKNEEYRISEQELQQGISISEDILSKIQTCMKNILQSKEEGGIKFYNSQWNHRVFAFDTDSRLIFKMKASKNCHSLDRDDSMKARYQTMIHAQTVVRIHQLGLLVIPNAKLFTVNVEGEEYEIIAERKVDINPRGSVQKRYFQDYAKSLNEAIRQLAIFTCKTNGKDYEGYSDIDWRNIPVLNNSLDENGNRKIALIDIEEMKGSEIGLFGGGWELRRGLVRCITLEQGEMVKTIAEQNGVSTVSFAKAHARRKEEIEEERKLKEYYTIKNIIVGNEPIQIDENLIDFPEYPRKIKELRQVTKNLVQEINDQIGASSSEDSIEERRYIYINPHHAPFERLDTKLIEPGENEYATAKSFKTDEEYYNATYLGYLVKKLIELGIIYSLDKRNGHGYYLQV